MLCFVLSGVLMEKGMENLFTYLNVLSKEGSKIT